MDDKSGFFYKSESFTVKPSSTMKLLSIIFCFYASLWWPSLQNSSSSWEKDNFRPLNISILTFLSKPINLNRFIKHPVEKGSLPNTMRMISVTNCCVMIVCDVHFCLLNCYCCGALVRVHIISLNVKLPFFNTNTSTLSYLIDVWVWIAFS